ncbi:MAG: doxx family protein [Flavobacteriales bacterium]|nr:doxx family protein [Flavobacteriales bacterium]
MRTEILARATSTPAATRKRIVVEPLTLVRWSIALCYIWFGALKFFPGLSPAEVLAAKTINALSLGLIHGQVAVVPFRSYAPLAWRFLTFRSRVGLHVLLAHMLFTFSPLFLFPDICFTQAPFALTLVGQYIIKNLVIASVAWMILKQDRPH